VTHLRVVRGKDVLWCNKTFELSEHNLLGFPRNQSSRICVKKVPVHILLYDRKAGLVDSFRRVLPVVTVVGQVLPRVTPGPNSFSLVEVAEVVPDWDLIGALIINI
jgi:hypothetical protein